MTSASLNQDWARAIVEELVLGGIQHAVVCPGSRSTPLAVALADHGALRIWSVVDERTAAFFGLGLAMSTSRPVVLVATSGTAGAHFLPAIIEAQLSAVPLVVLTADRPWELHGFGAAQTIAQENLFGTFARTFEGMPAPDPRPECFTHLRCVVARAAAEVSGPDGGVAHLNVPFREPLAPSDAWPATQPRGDHPALTIRASSRAPDRAALETLARELSQIERGIIVCGPRRFEDGFREAVRRLGQSLGYPVLAEAASNARFGPGPEVIAHADLLLQSATFAEARRPEVVLRFGGGLTSKRLATWLDASRPRTILVRESATVMDPSHLASTIIEGDAKLVCEGLASATRQPSQWRAAFHQADREARGGLEAAFARNPDLTEPRIACEVVASLPSGSSLFVSSSMPIREVDSYSHSSSSIRVFANRGANGIDGIVSSALGVAAGGRRPTVLLTGDLALLHDLGGLLIARRHRIPLTIVAVNNDGGGIFSFLPVAGTTSHFEELFGTPHGMHFAPLAELFGARYRKPKSASELRAELTQSFEGGLHLLEVEVPRDQNPKVHRDLADAVRLALQSGSGT